jgi:hypothetical protein
MVLIGIFPSAVELMKIRSCHICLFRGLSVAVLSGLSCQIKVMPKHDEFQREKIQSRSLATHNLGVHTRSMSWRTRQVLPRESSTDIATTWIAFPRP